MMVLVTGSLGTIGSEAIAFFDAMGCHVLGVDTCVRQGLLGDSGVSGASARNRQRLLMECRHFTQVSLDVRDRAGVDQLFQRERIDLVIHAAALLRHDAATATAVEDFVVSSTGTLHVLEACRRHRPGAVFVHVSSNLVYGDAPNHLPLQELVTRFEYADAAWSQGVDEQLTIDQQTHTLAGVGALAGDLLTQEYARSYGLRAGVFRMSSIACPRRAGADDADALTRLIACALNQEPYSIHGSKGKQLHEYLHGQDAIAALWAFAQKPRPGEVYNLGGGKHNAASLLEVIEMIAQRTGKRPQLTYDAKNRIGDHICYYSDLRKLQAHYPGWKLGYSLAAIVDDIIACVERSLQAAA
jgi:CDP-paratose 2-epimerase